MQENLFTYLTEYESEMIRLRRDFHRHPELSFQEVRTPAKIAAFYDALGIPYRANVGGSGIVATLTGTRPGKTIAIRADFDALPLQEETELSFRSIRPGVMHACGHDGHTAIVLGLAAAFHAIQDELAGTVVFIHQHGEEVFPGGAIQMIEDGCLDGVDAIFGTHLENDLPVGSIGYHSGHTLCAIDEFEIVVHGQGGHAQAPHRTQDALVAGAQLVCNLQHLVSRRVDPFEPAIVAIGSFHAGTAPNIVTGEARIVGEIRTFNEQLRHQLRQQVDLVARTTCSGVGADYSIDFTTGYPSLWNHPDETQLVREAAGFLPEAQVREMKPMMAADDFAYYLEKVPGSYFFTGSAKTDGRTIYPQHHPKYEIDERALLIGAKTLGATVLRALQT